MDIENAPAINLTVDLTLDENGRPSTDPTHVVKFSQQLLFKAVLDRTANGTQIPVDLEEMSTLLRDMNSTALTTRKLDQEAQAIGNQKVLVETHKELMQLFKGQNIYNPEGTSKPRDVYGSLELPDVVTDPSELQQGEQKLNPDDFISGD